MNNLHSDNKEHNPPQNLQVWYCGHCQAVHFKTGNVMLNFSRTEFADLTRSVVDIYSQEFGELDIFSLLDSTNHEDEVLLSETIA